MPPDPPRRRTIVCTPFAPHSFHFVSPWPIFLNETLSVVTSISPALATTCVPLKTEGYVARVNQSMLGVRSEQGIINALVVVSP